MNMMKKNGFRASVVVLFLLAAVPGYCTSGNVNFFIGQKSMDDSDFWEPVDDHTEFGVNFDMIEKGWPVSLDLGLMMSSDESSDDYGSIEGKTNELYVGIKKIWVIRNFPLKPFISGGLAYVSAEMEGEDAYGYYDDDDSAMGFYLSAGAYATLSKHLNLGLLFRISKADVELFNNDVDAGGEHFGLFLGYHF